MKQHLLKSTPVLLAGLILCPQVGYADPVGFNFMDPADNNPYPPPDGYKINEGLDPTEIAGVVPQTNWNNMWQGGTGFNVPAGGGVTITWATPCGGTHALTAYVPPPPDFKLMRGYLDNCDNTNSPDIVTVSGLSFPLYDVICYSVGDNGSATRVSKFTLTSTNNGLLFTNITKYVQDDGGSVFDGSTYIEANSTNDFPSAASGNYCRFHNIRGTNLTIRSVGAYASDGHPRGPFNALQIVPIDVTPVLSNPSYADGQFQFFLNGATNVNYIIMASTNLVDWFPVSTNAAPAQITNLPPLNIPYRFYRALFQ